MGSTLLVATPLTEQQFITVNTDLSPWEAAADYQTKLVESLGAPGVHSLPRLDLLLLGAGPDGHTCSLFPRHPLLAEPAPQDGGRLVASIEDSPKPPPERVTLTIPVVNSALCCVFAAVGAGKAPMVAQLLGDVEPADPTDLPARLVKPTNGELYWILDQGAAANLKL